MSMIDTTKAVAFALSLGLVAGAAVAQDTTQPAPTETPAAEAPATTPAAPAETPAAAQPADGPGSVYLKGTEGDWEMRCIRVEAGQTEPCQMYQLLKDDKGNSVAEISVFPLATGQKAVTGATVSVPLETLLTDNLVIQVDFGQTAHLPLYLVRPSELRRPRGLHRRGSGRAQGRQQGHDDHRAGDRPRPEGQSVDLAQGLYQVL